MKLFERLRKILPHETVYDQIRVLMYQLGDLVKCLHKAKRFPELEDAYKAEITVALADLITQIEITCRYLDVDFEKIRDLGATRFQSWLSDYERRLKRIEGSFDST